MIRVKYGAIDQDAIIVQSISFGDALTNILAILVTETGYQSRDLNLSQKEMYELISSTLCTPTEFVTKSLVSAKVGDLRLSDLILIDVADEDEGMIDETVDEEEEARGRDGRSSKSQSRVTFSDIVLALLRPLFRGVAFRDDWGACYMTDLLKIPEGPYQEACAVDPGLGWPRPRLAWDPGLLFPGPKEAFNVPHYDSPLVRALTVTLLRMDFWRWSLAFFLPPDVVKTIRRTDRIFGDAVSMQYIAHQLWKLIWAYRNAAVALVYSFGQRMRSACRAVYGMYRVPEQDLVALDDLVEKKMESIPLPPFATYLKNAFGTGKIDTRYGLHPVTWISSDDGCPTESRFREDDVKGTNCDRVSVLSNIYRTYLEQLAAATLRGSQGVCFSSLGSLRPNPPERFINAVRFVTEYEAAETQVGALNDVSRRLGWGSIPAEIGTLRGLDCDFIMTDGRYIDGSIDQAALGLSPVLSIANWRFRSLTPMTIRAFMVNKPPIVFALPVHGRSSETSSRAFIQRKYIPRGMRMGEEAVLEINRSFDPDDELARQTHFYYGTVAKTFTREFIKIDSVPETVAGIYLSSWTVFGTSYVPATTLARERCSDTTQTQRPRKCSELAVAWELATIDVSEPSSTAMLIQAPKGTELYLREPIYLVREQAYGVFDRIGVLQQLQVKYAGKVETTGVVSLAADMAGLDKLMVCAPENLTLRHKATG